MANTLDLPYRGCGTVHYKSNTYTYPVKSPGVQANNIRSRKFPQEFHSMLQRVSQTALHVFSIYCGDEPQLLPDLSLPWWKSFDLLLAHATLHDLSPALGRERKLVENNRSRYHHGMYCCLILPLALYMYSYI